MENELYLFLGFRIMICNKQISEYGISPPGPLSMNGEGERRAETDKNAAQGVGCGIILQIWFSFRIYGMNA